jgi:hypothetical protein
MGRHVSGTDRFMPQLVKGIMRWGVCPGDKAAHLQHGGDLMANGQAWAVNGAHVETARPLPCGAGC